MSHNQSHTTGLSRRDFLHGSAGVALAAGTAAILARNDDPTPTLLAQQTIPVEGMASFDSTYNVRPYRFDRRAVGPRDVLVDINYCGVCHSDIHTALDQWGPQRRPQVTGHEMAGTVQAVGAQVSQFREGDRVGVGTFVDSCMTCAECLAGAEQYCLQGAMFSYGTPPQSYADPADYPGGYTQGGYSTAIVVKDHFVYPVPGALELADAAPLMCAGVTVWSPLKRWNVGPGSQVGVLGIGGLGHLAIQLARALGADVVAFTTTADKVADAQRFGASDVVVNADTAQMAKYSRHFDFILDTIPVAHPLDPFVSLLKRGATLCRVGIGDTTTTNEFGQFSLTAMQNSIAGSDVGSVQDVRDVLAFSAAHNIRPQVTIVPADEVAQYWPRVVDKQARYRYVLDTTALR